MRFFFAFFIFIFIARLSTAQTYTETFEGISAVGTVKPFSFTTGGQGFTTTSAVCSTGNNFGVWIPNHAWTNCNGVTATNLNVSNYGVGTSCTSGSCSGTSSKFIDASAVGSSVNQVYSIKTSDAALFTMRSMHVFLSTDNAANPGGSSVTFRGKRGGVTKFTVTKSSGLVTTFSTNNGFNYINFVTEGGANNTLTNIDEIEMQGGGAVNYVAVDNFVFGVRNGPLVTTSAATAVTGSTVTLNGIVNDNGLSTTSIIFEYSTSPTLASGVSTVTATPSSLGANAGNTSASANVTGLIGSTTYYFRVKATNAGGTNTGSILNFSTSAASSPSVTVTSQTNVACNGGNTGALTVTASGGTTPYGYSWAPSGGTAATATGLAAGIYTCTVTDGASMTATVTATITQPSAIGTSTVVTNVACNGGNTGAINLTPSGGTPGYTFSWVGGPSTEDRTGLAAGSYTCVVTDANTCTRTVTATVTQPTAVGGSRIITNVACNGGTTGAIDLTPSGGTPGYTYNWGGGVTTQDRTGLAAGSYTCVVTDANACTGTVTATVTQPTAVGGSRIITNVACNGGTTGSIDLTPSGGTPGYTYNWGGGITTQDRTGLAAGGYTCTVTDANSCTGTVTATVTQPTAVSGTRTITNVACNGSTTGAIDLTPSGGTPGYTYNWGGGVTTQDRTGLFAGGYTCTITDANSCTGTVTATVTQPAAPVGGSTIVTNVACRGTSTGSIDMTPSGGTPGYTYNWGGGVTTQDRTGLAAGASTCVVTDANACTGTVTATVTQPAAVVGGSTIITNVACGGTSTGAIDLTPTGGSPGYTYNWGGGVTTQDRTGLAAGGYTCTVTDANSCTGTVTATVTQPTAISVTPASQTNVSCFGSTNGAASINTPTGGAGGFTYNWTPGNPTGDGTVSVTGLTAQSYTCTVTDANSCTAQQTFNITAPSAIVVTPASQTNISCFGGTNGAASINTPTGGAGGYTYNWTPGTPTGDGTVSVTGLSAGTWTCTVTDANSCTAQQTFNITAPSAIVVTPASQTNISCFGGTNGAASINTPTGGAGGYTYNWTPGTPTGDGTVSVTGLSAGSWTCTVTDANSCTAQQTFNIAAPSATLAVSSSAQTNLTCFGGNNGAASVSVSGGTTAYAYNWTPGNPTGDGTASVTGLTAGTWTCTVTDANACTTTQTFNITSPSALVVTPLSQTNVSCNGGSNGAASISVSGGVTAYTYNWTPGTPTGDGTTSVTGLTAGSWTCTVTDANSCSAQQAFNITQPPVLAVTAASQTNVTCFGGSNGAATVNTPTGGAGSYTYNWTPGTPTGDGTVSVSGLTAGSWTCTVTDANTCTTTQTFTITSPSSLVVTPASQTNVSCFGANNGAASINTATGGAGGYTYDWTPGTPTGDGTVSVSGLTAGTWTCTVTDANACTAMQQFTITAPTPFVVTPASQTNVLCNGGSNGAASINTPTGGAGGYTYNWTPGNPTGDGTVSVTGLTAGSWTCTVTDANSCISSHTFTITEPPAVSGTITGSDNLCQSATTTLTISGMSGGVWSSTNTAAGSVNPTTGVVTGISGGTTTISYTVTDVCGTAAATKIITVTSLPGAISGTLAICEGTTTTLGNAASGGTWSSSNSGVASVNGTTGAVSGAGAGTAMISYSTGCGTPSTATMTINPIPAAISGTATICIGGTTTLSNSVSGGTWSSGTPAVATVHPTTGVVTGVSAGNSDISYIMGCASVKRIVTVNGGPAVAAVTGSSSVCEGATISLSDATADGTWSSSNTGIATVGTSGIVTGVSGGTAAISYIVTATCGSSYAVKIVTVHSLPAPISGTASVCEGNTTALSTTPGGGTWSSSTVAASVHPSTGLVTGDNEGSTIISYQSPAGCYRTIEVTVNATPGIIVGSAVTCVGTTTTLSAPPGGGTWSSSFPGKATVDVNSGVVTGVSAGTTIISYNLPFGCRSTTVVTVITTPASITGSLTLCGGSTSALSSATTGGVWSSSDAGVATINAGTGVVTGISTGTTTISYATGSCATSAVVTVGGTMTGSTGTALVCAGQAATLSNATSGGTWSSSNTAAATVHAATGLVTGVGAGTTNITYTLSGGCYSVTEVTVNATMASITGSGTVCAGSTTPLSHADGGGVWSSSNTSRVTIDAGSGIMTGVAGGSATISYVLSAGCVTTRVITVNVLPNTIGGGGAAMCLGGGTTFSCTPSGGTWSSTTTGVATIGSTGVISSVSTGTSVISYTISTGCASTRTVTVLASPSAITGSATACIGSTTTLSSSPAGGTWTSSVPSKATVVAATGVVTGVAAGNSTITYTLSTGCRRTIIATVVTLPGAIGGVLTLCSSCTTTLTSATFSGTWTSSNAGVATVNPTTGVVSGVGVGTATISYTVGTGCSRTAVVTVGTTPASITGTHVVCVGQTNATLDHPVPVGTWSSSNTAVATVHAATGIFTGISSGTATISYIISPGYYATTAVTVEPAVATISGNSGICPGATMMLSNTTPSGVWSSNSPLKATVDPGTGLVTAITTGTAAITYTVGVGCYNVAIVTVNTVPNIMGSNTVANGGTTTLTGSPAGGVWASADAGVASVVAGTGVVTGVSLGATSMSYTIGAGCSGVRTITVVVPRPGMSGATGGEESSAQLLKVYPNPTSGTLTVEAPVAGRFNVYTIDGREVAQYAVTASANMVTLPSNLTAGIYMCRFVGADGTSAIVRLVYEQ